jgi:hypothetical protein
LDTKQGSSGPRFTKARKFVKQFVMTSSTIYDHFTGNCDLRPKRNNNPKIYNFENAKNKKRKTFFQQL